MAEWIPPKTNWQAGDIPGAGDFNRSEGNLQHLKDYSLVWCEPSNEILLESLAQKSVSSETYKTMKTFRLAYPGRYKVTFEARRDDVTGLWMPNNARIYVFTQAQAVELTASWRTYTITGTVTSPVTTFNIQGAGKQTAVPGSYSAPLAVYIRNVRIYASPVPMPSSTFTLD